MTDWELLRDYVGRRSEAAFARLVERHWRMVLAACRREVDNVCLAEDAAQGTILVLARRARMLQRKDNLAAWLFVTARLTAKNASRHERRRIALERRAAEMTEASSTDDEGTWPRLAP